MNIYYNIFIIFILKYSVSEITLNYFNKMRVMFDIEMC
jgi:hypothetical protein